MAIKRTSPFDGRGAQVLLRSRGVKVAELARVAGLHPSSVERILNGRHPAGWVATAKLERALHEMDLYHA
jgi:hypothetical protein